EEEERQDALGAHLRFDIPRLATRLGEVTDWVRRDRALRGLKLGYFGASTGAAAALIAAAERPDAIHAIVSRGGRPDLAAEALLRLDVPTQFIVGGDDGAVLELNQAAYEELHGAKQLTIVPGATHLFEEPGALDEVSRIAGDWFAEYLSGAEGDWVEGP
ncbi:MAG TPA: hydrolase, partial [Archangium sp.]